MCLPDRERSLGVSETAQAEGDGRATELSPIARGVWTVITLPDALLRWIALKLIRFYQVAISPWTPPSCIYTPTCSAYGYQAIAKYGFFKGGVLTAWRILRCNPWAHGGHDPVP